MNYTLKQKVIWLSIFGIAMGFLETAVVVYLRIIYYPDGFDFPLAPITGTVALTEILREAATLLMLVGIGILAGKNNTERFACFLFSFAVWDIFYYVFLKLLINWPVSIFTWDILFLIPVPWVGPVIAPVITSLSMIWLFYIVMKHSSKYPDIKLKKSEVAGLIIGSTILIIAFVWDYFAYQKSIHYHAIDQATQLNDLLGYIPQRFNWPIFIAGQLTILIIIYFIKKRFHHESSHHA